MVKNVYELRPVWVDKRQSFYKKAWVICTENSTILRSYRTNVAEVITNEYGKRQLIIYGFYSPTTLRHIKEFAYQMGFAIGSMSYMEKEYCI